MDDLNEDVMIDDEEEIDEEAVDGAMDDEVAPDEEEAM